MRRKALDFLREWKQKDSRKPLVIRGARQVGKTWLMKEFARAEYENFVGWACCFRGVQGGFDGTICITAVIVG